METNETSKHPREHGASQESVRINCTVDAVANTQIKTEASLSKPAESKSTEEDAAEALKLEAADSKPAPLILVLHASVGSGHQSCAKAIEDAFLKIKETQPQRTFPGLPEYTLKDLEIEVIDILSFGRVVFNGSVLASSFTGSMRPFYDVTWRFFLTGRLLWGGGTIWSRAMYPEFTKYVEQKNPAAIVCTHICGANVAVGARALCHKRFPIVCVPTDYESEGLWPHRASDLFCVANETMAETLRARKVEDARIAITGIPAKIHLEEGYERDKTRLKHQLPLDKRLVLVMAGASLSAPYKLFREVIDSTLPYLDAFRNSLHFVFLTGSDEDYANALQLRCKQLELSNISILGYQSDVAALMNASDFAICKAGGLTVTECLYVRLPMILVGKTYGQEKVNRRFLTAMGAAIHVTTHRELFEALLKIKQNPEALRSMLMHAEYLRQPNAAASVAEKTLEQMGRIEDQRQPDKHLADFYWGENPAHVR